ncbi:hypothetical protein N7478_002007 [Penicillium angulare]|uniref:uncharacterized protein n=1 Tax=Penicillium angulare TaxID=116970 RepID=UPI002541BE24|nr:uncharacterized protein N7478_002007 [Penicillium angulare]KAJ5288977.1 hypothetical protein N7478_002007 [Penicillium angulare]
MPYPATPSPFRLSRRQPSTRRTAGPQFANSPRFLFSQTTQTTDGDSDIADDDFPPSTAPVGLTPRTHQDDIPSRSRRDVIVDWDDEDLPRSTCTQRKPNNPACDIIDSTPPEALEGPGIFDAGDEDNPEVHQDSNKRRRILEENLPFPQNLGESIEEQSESSPDRPHNVVTAPPATPAAHPPPDATTQISSMQAPIGGPAGLGTPTPASTRTPFHVKPRFILSAKKPPASQPAFRAETPAPSYPASTPAEKRKPTFVLPASPSPKKPVDDIPAPFSPSSRSLRRRGRPRAGASGYTSGGMAAEVRSWVLDMGSKREQARHTNAELDEVSKSSDEFSQYVLAARVLSVAQGSLSSSGPLAFIQVERVKDSSGKKDDSNVLNILAMGDPRSKPQSCSRSSPIMIQAGDWLGFHRGLAWDMDLASPRGCESTESMRNLLRDTDGIENCKQHWLVAMEWDLISEAT